jgi:dephospho-CoA kinase
MIHVALTGNVAAGKSTVARLFAEWGATVIDADAIVHDLQRPGTAVFEAMVARFGTTMLRPDGALDRPALRRMVLADPAARRDLEAIVHPAVAARRKELVAEAERQGRAVVVSDIPLLFEATDPTMFEHIVLVDATPAIRRDRLIHLRGLAPEEADRMIATQMPSAGKRARSTEVIDNDGSPGELDAAARAVWNRLEAAAANA